MKEPKVAVRCYRRTHAHACPNCGADERAVTTKDKWSSRGDLLCADCGYEVGACAAPCEIPLPQRKEKGK